VTPHVHVGIASFVTLAASAIVFTTLWRAATARLADRPVGAAMAAVYS
jgi:hypothetical protein